MICSSCGAVLMDGDKHRRCLLHRRCKQSKPCALDKDWSELQWKSFNASVEAQKLANKQPKRGASSKNTGNTSKGALGGPGKQTGSSSTGALSGPHGRMRGSGSVIDPAVSSTKSHGMSSMSLTTATTVGPEATLPIVSDQPSVGPGVTNSGDSNSIEMLQSRAPEPL